MKHLYVHIPFCRSRCAYCDFASEALAAESPDSEPSASDPLASRQTSDRVQAYLAALRSELGAYRSLLEEPVETIYLGGGTPTILPRDALLGLVEDLAALQRPVATPAATTSTGATAAGATSVAEFTVEANPGTVGRSLLEDLRAAGVTRLSLGVQSFSADLRGNLGRCVDDEEIESALAAVRESGWAEWNIDLIFGIPGQTCGQAAADLSAAVAAGPTHISLYDLTYTSTYAAHVRGRMGAAAVERATAFAEQHLARAVQRLETAGYRRYEVSNFARPGHECRHNLAYWQGEDYMGVGASAVSTIAGERRTNPRSVDAYLAGEPPEVEVLSDRTRLWEKAMLGLRTADGVEEERILPVLSPEGLRLLLEQGCVERRCGKLRLNPGFLDVSNSVLATLLETPSGG